MVDKEHLKDYLKKKELRKNFQLDNRVDQLKNLMEINTISNERIPSIIPGRHKVSYNIAPKKINIQSLPQINLTDEELENIKNYYGVHSSCDSIINRVGIRDPIPLPDYIKIRTDSIHSVRNSRSFQEMIGNFHKFPKFFKMMNFYLSGSNYGDQIIGCMARTVNRPLLHVLDGIQDGISVNWGIIRGSEYILWNSIRKNQPFIYLDHGYFNYGHQLENPSYKITIGAFQAREIKNVSYQRFKKLNLKIKDWKLPSQGQYIIVAPPTDAVMNFYGVFNWLNMTIETLRKYTDRAIVVRQKPLEISLDYSSGRAMPISSNKVNFNADTPLEEQLKNAYAVVTFNSNIATEAILNGVPVFVDETSAAYSIGSTDLSQIEKPVFGDQEEWCAHLANNQIYLNEIKNGTFWDVLEDK